MLLWKAMEKDIGTNFRKIGNNNLTDNLGRIGVAKGGKEWGNCLWA